MITQPASYAPKSQEYYNGFEDGYLVARNEVREFYERMGMDKNTFTGTVCCSRKDADNG